MQKGQRQVGFILLQSHAKQGVKTVTKKWIVPAIFLSMEGEVRCI